MVFAKNWKQLLTLHRVTLDVMNRQAICRKMFAYVKIISLSLIKIVFDFPKLRARILAIFFYTASFAAVTPLWLFIREDYNQIE